MAKQKRLHWCGDFCMKSRLNKGYCHENAQQLAASLANGNIQIHSNGISCMQAHVQEHAKMPALNGALNLHSGDLGQIADTI